PESMATKKQRKRSQKERRHEYETVWVDAEGNELEEPPDDAPAPAREARPNGGKPQQKQAPQSRATTRTPLPPSWRRATKRAALLGGFILIVMYVLNSKSGGNRALGAIEI